MEHTFPGRVWTLKCSPHSSHNVVNCENENASESLPLWPASGQCGPVGSRPLSRSDAPCDVIAHWVLLVLTHSAHSQQNHRKNGHQRSDSLKTQALRDKNYKRTHKEVSKTFDTQLSCSGKQSGNFNVLSTYSYPCLCFLKISCWPSYN